MEINFSDRDIELFGHIYWFIADDVVCFLYCDWFAKDDRWDSLSLVVPMSMPLKSGYSPETGGARQ